ncbi:Uncharacterised protein [Staphylococcus pseudintermedius]|nr:Uncharacterised protein [Staphylococcus pseudintermedius]
MLISKRGKKPNILAKIADISFPPFILKNRKYNLKRFSLIWCKDTVILKKCQND